MALFNGNFYSLRFSSECVCPKCIQLIPNYRNFIFYIALRWTSIWNITSYISYYQRICAWKGSNLLFKDLKGGVNGEQNYCYHEISQILFTLDEIKFEKFTNRLHLKFKRNYWKIEMNLRAFTTLNNFAGEFRKLESFHAHP